MNDATLKAISEEAERAAEKYGQPSSTHESLGVLMEEFSELQQAIHDNRRDGIEHEAIQVAAVAYRLAVACAFAHPAFLVRSGLRAELRKASV